MKFALLLRIRGSSINEFSNTERTDITSVLIGDHFELKSSYLKVTMESFED